MTISVIKTAINMGPLNPLECSERMPSGIAQIMIEE